MSRVEFSTTLITIFGFRPAFKMPSVTVLIAAINPTGILDINDKSLSTLGLGWFEPEF